MAFTDESNGYDAISKDFISIRNGSGIGIATVCDWAGSLPPGSTILDLGGFLFTAPQKACEWTDSLTGQNPFLLEQMSIRE